MAGAVQEMAFQPFDFNTLLKNNIDNHLEAVQRISGTASKEFSLAKALSKMQADWQGVQFNVLAYKDTGTFILGGVDEVQVPALLSPFVHFAQSASDCQAQRAAARRQRHRGADVCRLCSTIRS